MGTSLWQPALLEGSTDQKEITFGWYSNKIFPPKWGKRLHYEYIQRQVSWCWNNLFIVAIVSFNKTSTKANLNAYNNKSSIGGTNKMSISICREQATWIKTTWDASWPMALQQIILSNIISKESILTPLNSLAPSRSTPPSSNTQEFECLLNAYAEEPAVKSSLHANPETTSYWLQGWEISLVF